MTKKLLFSRIYHFILDPRIGGPHVYVKGLSEMLATNSESIVVTAGKGPNTDWPLANLRHTCRALYPIELVINVIQICWFFRKKSSRENTVIDVHGAANLAPIIAAWCVQIPVVWHFHETEEKYFIFVRFGKMILKGVVHAFVVVARRAQKVYDLPDAHHIPGGIDVDFWTCSRDSKPRSNVLRLLAVGNINPLKGFDFLLEALKNGLDIPVKLVVAGAILKTFQRYASDLQHRAAQLKDFDCEVEFAGWQSPTALRTLMLEADIFVLPSRSEACPLALLEAMASGCACAATNVGDVSELLSGSAGVLIDNVDPEAIRAGILEVFGLGFQGRLRMGDIAKERIIRSYSLAQMAAQHRVVYSALIAQGRS